MTFVCRRRVHDESGGEHLAFRRGAQTGDFVQDARGRLFLSRLFLVVNPKENGACPIGTAGVNLISYLERFH